MSIGIDSVGIDRVSAGVSSLGANLEGFDPALAAQFEASLQSARQNNTTAGPRYADRSDDTVRADDSVSPGTNVNNTQPVNPLCARCAGDRRSVAAEID